MFPILYQQLEFLRFNIILHCEYVRHNTFWKRSHPVNHANLHLKTGDITEHQQIAMLTVFQIIELSVFFILEFLALLFFYHLAMLRFKMLNCDGDLPC